MATTFVPSWSTATAPIVGRGAGQLLDLDFTTGYLGRNARGGIGLVTGPVRLESRIARAVLTAKGVNPFHRQYGSEALPGQTTGQSIALQLADVVLTEARRYASEALTPDQAITGIRVDSVATNDSPLTVSVNVTIYTADGGSTPSVLTLPVG